jgi:intein-encoded DNA endonuclease-like protein
MEKSNRYYHRYPKKLILEVHKYILDERKSKKCGQRTLSRLVKKKFKINISEATISSWIHHNHIPYSQEKTQFKPKKSPPKQKLEDLYLKKEVSANQLGKLFNTTGVTAKNWLIQSKIKPRTKLEAMNIKTVKENLRNKKLIQPTKDYSKLTQEKAYILGVLIGDGHISNTTVSLEIRNDEEFIKEFANCINKTYGLNYSHYYYQKNNTFRIYVSPEAIVNDLNKYGDFYTYTWNVPNHILKSKNEKIISNFLRGYYDSEGTINKGCISVTSVSRNGLSQIKSLLSFLGIKSSLSNYKGKYYYLLISNNQNRKIFQDKIGFTIKRKAEKLKNIIK